MNFPRKGRHNHVHKFRVKTGGGILILSTPQRYSTLELTARFALLPGIIQLVKWIYNEPVLETGHINLMADVTVKHQLEKACFEVLERHKSGLYLPFIAEFFGIKGLQFEQWIEKKLIDRRSDKLLWTQYYVAKKANKHPRIQLASATDGLTQNSTGQIAFKITG